MKIFTAPFFLFICMVVQAQVGVGTILPQATLDITGQPTVATQLDGVIPPRLTGNQLRAKTYTATQTAAIVYVTAADSAPAGQTVDVTQAGYYYFNGTKWIKIAPESNDWTITGNANTNASTNFIGTTNDVDLMFRRNNLQSGWLSDTTTGFGVNTINPSTSTGVHNTALGQTTLQVNTTGHRNTGIGSGVLSLNTDGYQNTAIGRYTMHFNTSGYNNMAIGQEAAKWNSTGHDNAAIGFNSLRQNGTGSFNVAIGRSAMATQSGGDVIYNVGDNNIAIGAFTELPVNSASNQMVLGGGPTATYPITRTIINGIVNSAGGRPANSAAPGVQGEIRVSNNGATYYMYIYCADNQWRRTTLTTF
jgi:hypothetical protein